MKQQREKITPRKIAGHFMTVTKHRFLVCKECFAVGLFRQGLCHDLSKYSPTEFLVGVRYFQGDRSPNNAEREEKGYSAAWLHHKGRNLHHYEYWMDYDLRAEKGIGPIKMPGRYVIEMFMDRVAASKVYNGKTYTDGDALRYYNSGRTAQFLHPATQRLLEKLLVMLAKEGEEATYAYIRAHLHKKKPVRPIRKQSAAYQTGQTERKNITHQTGQVDKQSTAYQTVQSDSQSTAQPTGQSDGERDARHAD